MADKNAREAAIELIKSLKADLDKNRTLTPREVAAALAIELKKAISSYEEELVALRKKESDSDLKKLQGIDGQAPSDSEYAQEFKKEEPAKKWEALCKMCKGSLSPSQYIKTHGKGGVCEKCGDSKVEKADVPMAKPPSGNAAPHIKSEKNVFEVLEKTFKKKPRPSDDPEKVGEFGERHDANHGHYFIFKHKDAKIGYQTHYTSNKGQSKDLGNFQDRKSAVSAMKEHHDQQKAMGKSEELISDENYRFSEEELEKADFGLTGKGRGATTPGASDAFDADKKPVAPKPQFTGADLNAAKSKLQGYKPGNVFNILSTPKPMPMTDPGKSKPVNPQITDPVKQNEAAQKQQAAGVASKPTVG